MKSSPLETEGSKRWNQSTSSRGVGLFQSLVIPAVMVSLDGGTRCGLDCSPNYARSELRYASDLTDAELAVIIHAGYRI
jgi:hypothetical protein